MTRKHSWKWLPSRFTTFRPATPSASAATRPPLAVLEQLEDRLLLSAAQGGGASDAIIAVLRNQISVRQAELNVLQIAGNDVIADKSGTKPTESVSLNFSKIEAQYEQLDDALSKLTVITARKSGGDQQEFLKIKLENVIVSSYTAAQREISVFGEAAQRLLLPAVQNVADAANNAISELETLGSFKLSSDNPFHKGDIADFLKFENDLGQIDQIVSKVTLSDITVTRHVDKPSTVLMQRLSDGFQKLNADLGALGDGSVFQALSQDLTSLKIDTLNFLDSLKISGGGGTVIG